MLSPNLIKCDYKNEEHRIAAAKLHEQLLHGSLLSELGFRFMAKFYYNRLIRDGFVTCDLYEYENRYVGWILYTKYPFTFMEKGMKKNFLYLSLILLVSLIRKPSRIKVFWKLNRFNAIRSSKMINDQGVGEYLSFGVLEEYRNIRDKVTGLKISKLLFDNSIEYFRDEGYNKMLLFVERQNKRAMRFYEQYDIYDIAEGNEDIRVMAIDVNYKSRVPQTCRTNLVDKISFSHQIK